MYCQGQWHASPRVVVSESLPLVLWRLSAQSSLTVLKVMYRCNGAHCHFLPRRGRVMPLHGLPFRPGLQVMKPCLITRDNGGQEIVTLSVVTSKQILAMIFLCSLCFSVRLRGTHRAHTFEYPNWWLILSALPYFYLNRSKSKCGTWLCLVGACRVQHPYRSWSNYFNDCCSEVRFLIRIYRVQSSGVTRRHDVYCCIVTAALHSLLLYEKSTCAFLVLPSKSRLIVETDQNWRLRLRRRVATDPPSPLC
jgi:hypothetical protein